VVEAAVIGQVDEDTGQAICAFVTLQGDQEGDERSGKILRRLVRDVAEGRELGNVTTLRDPEVMKLLAQRVAERQDEEDGG
jgi:acetyl-CoA synthetase